MYRYEITKKFIDGILKGLSVKEKTNIPFRKGATYRECLGVGSYKVTKINILVDNVDYID